MSLSDDIASLGSVELFSFFNEEQLRLIAFGSQRIEFREGMELFHNGQTSDGGFVVMSGEVSIDIHDAKQVEHTTRFGPGSLIGELALFTRNRRTGTAKITKDAELMKIRRDVMHRVLSEYPELAAQLYDRIADNVVTIGKDLERIGKRLESGV